MKKYLFKVNFIMRASILGKDYEQKDTMFVAVQNNRSSGRVVSPLAAGRSPTEYLF